MIRKLFSSQLRINMVSGVAAMLLNTVVLAAGYPIYLHFLGYEQYGVWLVLATVLTFSQLGNLGINQAVTKLVAEEYGRGDTLAIQQYVTTALAILGLSGIVVLSGLLVLRGPIVAAFNLGEENAKIALWLLPYVGLLSIYVFLTEVLQGTLSGLGRMDLANGIQSLGGLVKLIVASLLLFAGLGIEGLLIAAVVSRVGVHVVSFLCIRRIVPIRLARMENWNAQRGKCLLHFGTGMLGGSLLSMLLSPFNKVMLSRYAGVASIPIYEIAYTGSMQIRGLAEAGIRALMPEVSRLGTNLAEQATTRIREINHRCVGLLIRLALPLYGILILIAPALLRIWLGDRFTEPLSLAFRIALLGSFLSLTCVPAYYLLLGMGRVGHCFMNYAILAGTNVLLVLTFAWVDNCLVLPEVLISAAVGMGLSSIYTILQNRRMLRHISARNSMGQELSEEHQIGSPRHLYANHV